MKALIQRLYPRPASRWNYLLESWYNSRENSIRLLIRYPRTSIDNINCLTLFYALKSNSLETYKTWCIYPNDKAS